MISEIDITFNFYSDTPSGKDPDSFSPTLRAYHKALWSKELSDGQVFELSDQQKGSYLYHNSPIGEFHLSSDAITHTYSSWRVMKHIISQLPPSEIEKFYHIGSTIGAYLIFPANKVNGKMTINGSRGTNRHIKDRFDLTLECIRCYYSNDDSPLKETLDRYPEFFGLFSNFQEYVDFFLLQDLVAKDYSGIKFWLKFEGFENSPLPRDIEEYKCYKESVINFVRARNLRIEESCQT